MKRYLRTTTFITVVTVIVTIIVLLFKSFIFWEHPLTTFNSFYDFIDNAEGACFRAIIIMYLIFTAFMTILLYGDLEK